MALPSWAGPQDDEGADGVGQNVPEGDAQMRETEGARRLDVLELADGEHARADDAGRPWHDGNRDGEDDVGNGRAESGGHHEGEHEQGQTLQDVHDALNDEVRLAPT
jgi:hypothetical protein